MTPKSSLVTGLASGGSVDVAIPGVGGCLLSSSRKSHAISKYKAAFWVEPEMRPNHVLSAGSPASDMIWRGGRTFGGKCTRKK